MRRRDADEARLQQPLGLSCQETKDQAMRVVFAQCRIPRSYDEVIAHPALRRVIEIMAENRLRRVGS